METMQYLLISTVCLSVSYLFYLLIARKEKNFKQLRFFLLGIIVLSVLIPLNNLKLEVDFQLPSTKGYEKITKQEQVPEMNNGETGIVSEETETTADIFKPEQRNKINIFSILKTVYLLVAAFFVFRLCLQIVKMLYYYSKAEKEKQKNYRLVFSPEIKHAFTFFNFIFIPKDYLIENSEKEKIIVHEKIHASQFHSIDILLIELLSAVMWFNPLVWMMRNSIQLVHEYLADEGALGTGIDKLKYQALLLNQATEERLICLSSSFNHSLIKKRMIMMTKSNFYQQSKLKILVLVPVAAILFFGVACVKGQDSSSSESIIKASNSQVVYDGVNNLLDIDLSPYKNPSVKLISNGHLTVGGNKCYLRPKKLGNALIEVYDDDELIFIKEYVVKPLPDSLKEKYSNATANNIVTAVAPAKMNVLYLGVDNPITIASSGYDASELEVSIDNGKIFGKNGRYTIYPGQTGLATVLVSHNGEVIQESIFRVKAVPNPVAAIPEGEGNNIWYNKGGEISKTQLLHAGGIIVFMQNFDFELEFKIVGFTISGVLGGFLQEIPTNGSSFSDKQIEFINKLSTGDKVFIEDIRCVGPSGTVRNLNQLIFRITEE